MTPTVEYSNSIKNLCWCSEKCQQEYYDTFVKCAGCNDPIIYKTPFEQIVDGKHYCCLHCLKYPKTERLPFTNHF